jgi:IS30 family transposase
VPSAADNGDLAQIAKQLDELKRLMIVQLLHSGAQSSHIAKALKVTPGTISKMLPVRDIQKHAAKRPQETD